MSSRIVFFITAPQLEVLSVMKDGKAHAGGYGRGQRVCETLTTSQLLKREGRAHPNHYKITKLGIYALQLGRICGTAKPTPKRKH